MKRLLLPVMVVLCVILSGCTVATQQISPESLQFSFHCPAVVTVGERSYRCDLRHDLTQKTVITLTEDSSLSTYTFTREGEGITVSYGELSHPARAQSFPKDSPFLLVAQVLDHSQSYTNLTPVGSNQFTGETEGKTFTLTCDGEGRITHLSIDPNITVEFLLETESSHN